MGGAHPMRPPIYGRGKQRRGRRDERVADDDDNHDEENIIMKALNDLRRFINTKNNDFEREEIRAYLLENAVDLALAFGVSLQAFQEAITKVDDDVELSIRVLDGI